MVIKLGKQIAHLRKQKGMTQEQLAHALGISPPAVSKWETDASCPDIALLCPLARALGTDVDTLLQFEENLSDEEAAEKINGIVELRRKEGIQKAEEVLETLLHEYPSSMALKYNAGAVLDFFSMSCSGDGEKWRKQKKALLEEIYENGVSAYWQNAVADLAAMALNDGEIKRAEELLKELPEHNTDTTLVRTRLYREKGQEREAREVLEKRLYTLLSQTQMCLISLMDEKLEPDGEKALKLWGLYEKTEELFHVGGGVGDGLLAEIYLRMGRSEESVEAILRQARKLLEPMRLPESWLFSFMKEKKEPAYFPIEMKKMFLAGLMKEECYAQYRESERFQETVRELEESIQKDEADGDAGR